MESFSFVNLKAVDEFIDLILLKMTNINLRKINVIFNINPNKINVFLLKNA